MKHHLSNIRREMAVAFALEHKEVKLADIGLALRIKDSHAAATVGGWLSEAGYKRPKGLGSPAYSAKVRRPRLLAKHRSEVKALVEAGVTYQEIAEKFCVSKDTAEDYAREVLGIRRNNKKSS